MSAHTTHNPADKQLPSYVDDQAPLHGLLAEFDQVDALMAACQKVRDAGYTRFDAHTPFAVHGLDAAMGVKPTKMPWIILGCGLIGMASAMLMQWWMNAIDYAWIISGKPLFSLPAFIPVTFELTVLLSVFATFFGTLGVNGLPAFFSPLATKKNFRRATNDRFFVYIQADDPIFDVAKTQPFLAACHPLTLEPVHYEVRGMHAGWPRGTVGIASILTVLALVPFAMFAKARESTSELPRLHLNPPAPIKDDMDLQYKFKPQTANWFFADGRAMRHWPQGTVADEDAVVATPYLTGKNDVVAAVQSLVPPEMNTQNKAQGPHKKHKEGAEDARAVPRQKSSPETAAQTLGGYVEALPPEVAITDATMRHGQERFNTYCSPCHGMTGHGDGMVARHADALQEGMWVTPSNLHDKRVRELLVGDLYNTVTHGVRNMPGYGHLIEPEDRWAIVMYVRALQLSQHAPKKMVPPELQPTLQ